MQAIRFFNSFLTVSLFLFATVAIAVFAASESTPQWKTFGEGVTIEKTTLISEINQRPEEHSGQTVAVEGTITGVCRMMGCWIELEDEDNQRIRLKVEDGVIVFPAEAQGCKAKAQGVVEVLDLTKEQILEHARHEAEERGEEFDPASVSDVPTRQIQLKGTGALIAMAPESQ